MRLGRDDAISCARTPAVSADLTPEHGPWTWVTPDRWYRAWVVQDLWGQRELHQA
jgi:hypothetical protein